MKSSFVRSMVLGVLFILALAVAQTASAQYTITNLTSNQPGKAAHIDKNLVNAWGVAYAPGGPFWSSDNGSGLSTLYDGGGNVQSLVVTIPTASGSGPGSPTGIVFNGTGQYTVSANGNSGSAFFIFATLDGTISGWNPSVDPTNAVIAVNNSASGAVYTGLAIINNFQGGTFIYAADTVGNKVDVYDGNFNFVKSFTDPSIPAGFTPYGIQNVGGKIFVTYASPTGGTGGFVDDFDGGGNLVRNFSKNGVLNQPWGLALAPSNFGQFSGALLVANNINGGNIHAFDFKTGQLLGALADSNGKVLQIGQLWAIAFGGGTPADGQKNQLFFTAGPNNYASGLFGVINAK